MASPRKDLRATYQIEDSTAFKLAVEWLLKNERLSWNQRKQQNPRLFRLRTTLTRLVSKNPPTGVTGATIDEIARQIEQIGWSSSAMLKAANEALEQLANAILSPSTVRLQRTFLEWSAESARVKRRGMTATIGKRGVRIVESTRGSTEARRARFNARVDVLRRCQLHEGCAGLLATFIADHQWVSPARGTLALLRIVEPLAACADAMFLERHVSELGDAELLDFIRAGITREEILLQREVDTVRAQSAEVRGKGIIAKRRDDIQLARRRGSLTQGREWLAFSEHDWRVAEERARREREEET
jgi:hypothetical protein